MVVGAIYPRSLISTFVFDYLVFFFNNHMQPANVKNS